MAARKSDNKKNKEAVTLPLPLPVFELPVKYNSRVIVPSAVVDKRYGLYLSMCKNQLDYNALRDALWKTLDGKTVKVKFIAAYNNSDGDYSAELNDMCERYYNGAVTFGLIADVWGKRLGRIDNFWNLIELW